MRQAGYSGPTRYDFDRSVMTLARVIENRSKETDTVWVDPPKPPTKGQVPVQKLRYTLAELLFEPTGDQDPNVSQDPDIADDSLAHLPAALL